MHVQTTSWTVTEDSRTDPSSVAPRKPLAGPRRTRTVQQLRSSENVSSSACPSWATSHKERDTDSKQVGWPTGLLPRRLSGTTIARHDEMRQTLKQRAAVQNENLSDTFTCTDERGMGGSDSVTVTVWHPKTGAQLSTFVYHCHDFSYNKYVCHQRDEQAQKGRSSHNCAICWLPRARTPTGKHKFRIRPWMKQMPLRR